MNGEECHNEWEITFEEIHRNGAIAFGIYNYIRHTGDVAYLDTYGLPVLAGIARFWAQRFNWSDAKQAYVMLGVTGPNEYENNVNNNWYTNFIARWCIAYCLEVNAKVQNPLPQKLSAKEIEKFEHIVANVYLPHLEDTNIFLQQEGFMDKEQLSAQASHKQIIRISQGSHKDLTSKPQLVSNVNHLLETYKLTVIDTHTY